MPVIAVTVAMIIMAMRIRGGFFDHLGSHGRADDARGDEHAGDDDEHGRDPAGVGGKMRDGAGGFVARFG